jgi:hypothetical protein
MTRPKILTSKFWTPRLDAATDGVGRSLRSSAQAVLGSLLQANVAQFNLFEVNATNLLGVAAGAAALSLLTSIAMPPKPA